MGQTKSALPRCSSIWYCCLLWPPSSVSRSHQLLRMLHRKLMQILGTTMVDTHMPIMAIMAILMPITGQEGREDQQSLTPSLQLMPRLTHGIFMEDTMDMDMDQDTLTTDTLMDTIWDKDHQNKTSMKCQKL